MRALGTEPGDAHRYARAVDRQLEHHTHTLAAEPPSWLTDLLGVRPADVAGATAWDDTVRDLARWRSLHQLPDTVPALGERPATHEDATAWDRSHVRLGLTRTWLATSDRIHPTDTITPSYHELLDRRGELDELLAACPPDWRSTINQLRTGQLTLDDTTELLQAAVDEQHTRRTGSSPTGPTSSNTKKSTAPSPPPPGDSTPTSSPTCSPDHSPLPFPPPSKRTNRGSESRSTPSPTAPPATSTRPPSTGSNTSPPGEPKMASQLGRRSTRRGRHSPTRSPRQPM